MVERVLTIQELRYYIALQDGDRVSNEDYPDKPSAASALKQIKKTVKDAHIVSYLKEVERRWIYEN